jgi:copper chaperone
MEERKIFVEGMSCGHCVRAVREALGRLDGVDVRSVEIGEVRVRFDPERTPEEDLVAAVEEEGYAVRR